MENNADMQLKIYFVDHYSGLVDDEEYSHKSIPEMLSLIRACHPNKPICFAIDSDLEPPRYAEVRDPDENNFSVFELFLLTAVSPTTDYFTTEETYTYYTAFMDAGGSIDSEMCSLIRARQVNLIDRLEWANMCEMKQNAHYSKYSDRFRALIKKDPTYLRDRYTHALHARIERLESLFKLVSGQCKRLAAEIIQDNPIFNRYMYSSGGPIERAWHPQTGRAFQKYTSELEFKNNSKRR